MVRTRKVRRGIYLLPTAFTIGNLFCGYASLVHSAVGAIEQAALLIVLAAVLDGLDGRIARATGSESDFGLQFDSLADIVSFGLAPALLAHRWALVPLERLGWLVGFVFVVCAAMRLARFNIQVATAEKRHFAGLPSPMAAAALAAAAFAFPTARLDGTAGVFVALMVVTIALLMVSRFRYRSFKELDLGGRRSYIHVLPLAAVLVAVAVRPKWALVTFSALYVLSGPVLYVWGVVRRRQRPVVESEVADGAPLR